MKVSTLNTEGLQHLNEGLDIIKNMGEEGRYFDAIKGITELMGLMKEDTEFCILLSKMRDNAKDMWKDEIEKNSK